MSNSSIWFIERTLSGTTTPAKVDLGAMAMKEYSASPKTPALLEPHIRWFSVITRILVGGCMSLTPPQRSSWCILLSQTTGPVKRVSTHSWYFLSAAFGETRVCTSVSLSTLNWPNDFFLIPKLEIHRKGKVGRRHWKKHDGAASYHMQRLF